MSFYKCLIDARLIIIVYFVFQITHVLFISSDFVHTQNTTYLKILLRHSNILTNDPYIVHFAQRFIHVTPRKFLTGISHNTRSFPCAYNVLN